MFENYKKALVLTMLFLIFVTQCSNESLEPDMVSQINPNNTGMPIEATLITATSQKENIDMTPVPTLTPTIVSNSSLTPTSDSSLNETLPEEIESEQTPTTTVTVTPQISNSSGLWVFSAIASENEDDMGLYLWSSTAQILEPLPLEMDSDLLLTAPTFSPDCGKVAYFSQKNEEFAVNLFDLQTEQNVRINTGLTITSGLAWSPLGKKIAYISGTFTENEISIINVETGQKQILDIPTAGRTPDWSPDGQTILFTSIKDPLDASSLFTHQITLFNFLDDKFTDLIDEPVSGEYTLDNPTRYGYWSPRWSPNGELITLISRISTESGFSVSRLYLMTNEGTEIRPLVPLNRGAITSNPIYYDHSPAWSSSGEEINFIQDFELEPNVWRSQICTAHVSDSGNLSCHQPGEITIISADYCSLPIE